MKLLLTSDWHMAGYRDPACRIKRDNDELLRLFDRWEASYDLILLNGDIFESLKSSEVRFDHFEHTERIIERRRPIVDRFLGAPYLWTAGNHDYPLEELLQLPMNLHLELDDDLQMFAEHGHLLRATREFYSEYHVIYHLLYCGAWWSSKLQTRLGMTGDSGDGAEALLHWYWRKTGDGVDRSSGLLSRLARFLFSKVTTPSDSNLPRFMLESVREKYKTADSLIVLGHSHYFQCMSLGSGRTYINTGRGYRHDRIHGVEFDTRSRIATRVSF